MKHNRGWGHKTGIKLCIYHPINLHGGEIRFVDLTYKSYRTMAKIDLPVDRHEIVKEKSVEEINAQLVSLVGENGAEMLISTFKSRRSISGPGLDG